MSHEAGRLEEAKGLRGANETEVLEPRRHSLSLSSKNIAASRSWNDVLLRDLVRRQNVTMTS